MVFIGLYRSPLVPVHGSNGLLGSRLGAMGFCDCWTGKWMNSGMDYGMDGMKLVTRPMLSSMIYTVLRIHILPSPHGGSLASCHFHSSSGW